MMILNLNMKVYTTRARSVATRHKAEYKISDRESMQIVEIS